MNWTEFAQDKRDPRKVVIVYEFKLVDKKKAEIKLPGE